MNDEKESKIEIMMVQLLFKNKPKSPKTEELRNAFEKYIGDLGEIPYAETSNESNGDMFMFPLLKYRAVLKDNPDYPTFFLFPWRSSVGALHQNKRCNNTDIPPLRTVSSFVLSVANCCQYAKRILLYHHRVMMKRNDLHTELFD